MTSWFHVFSFFFRISTSVDGDRQQQQQQTSINDIFYSNNSSFVRNLNDVKRSEPYVLCQIFSDGQALCLPVQTSFKSFSDKWKYVLTFFLFSTSSQSIVFFSLAGMNGLHYHWDIVICLDMLFLHCRFMRLFRRLMFELLVVQQWHYLIWKGKKYWIFLSGRLNVNLL